MRFIQQIHQWSTLPGPLVLGEHPLKFQRSQQIRTELSHARISIISYGADYIFIFSDVSEEELTYYPISGIQS